MKYFSIEPMGKTDDRSLCMLDTLPGSLGRSRQNLTLGKKLSDEWPADAHMIMSPDFPGMKLSSVLGNACGYLVCHREVAEVIRGICRNDIEYLPIAVWNHRRQSVSDEYLIVNVIGTVDCLDDQASNVRRDAKGQVFGMGKPVIDAKRMVPDLHLFRVTPRPSCLIMSIDLGAAFGNRKFTNIAIKKVDVVNA